MNKKYIYKVVILILFLLALTVGADTCEGQDKSFVYSTDLDTVLFQYTTAQSGYLTVAQFKAIEAGVTHSVLKTEKDNSLTYVAVGLVLLDIAIRRYYYRNQYWRD